MDKMPLAAVVCQSFPESVLLFALGLTLMGAPLRWRRIIFAAVIYTAISCFVRSLPLPYGIHTITGLVVMCALFIVFFRSPLQLAATASLLSILTLGVLEILFYPLVLATGLSIKEIWARPLLRILIPFPELISLGIITWWCAKKKITFTSSRPFQQKAEEEKQNRGHQS
ncbi:MAG: hypothetical protein AB1652_04795 [Bacillota bacterium]